MILIRYSFMVLMIASICKLVVQSSNGHQIEWKGLLTTASLFSLCETLNYHSKRRPAAHMTRDIIRGLDVFCCFSLMLSALVVIQVLRDQQSHFNHSGRLNDLISKGMAFSSMGLTTAYVVWLRGMMKIDQYCMLLVPLVSMVIGFIMIYFGYLSPREGVIGQYPSALKDAHVVLVWVLPVVAFIQFLRHAPRK